MRKVQRARLARRVQLEQQKRQALARAWARYDGYDDTYDVQRHCYYEQLIDEHERARDEIMALYATHRRPVPPSAAERWTRRWNTLRHLFFLTIAIACSVALAATHRPARWAFEIYVYATTKRVFLDDVLFQASQRLHALRNYSASPTIRLLFGLAAAVIGCVACALFACAAAHLTARRDAAAERAAAHRAVCVRVEEWNKTGMLLQKLRRRNGLPE